MPVEEAIAEELEPLEEIAEAKPGEEQVLAEQQITSDEFKEVPVASFVAKGGNPVVDETQFIEPMCIGEPHKDLPSESNTDMSFSVALPDFSSLDTTTSEPFVDSSPANAAAPVVPPTDALPVKPAEPTANATPQPALESVDISEFVADNSAHGPVKISVNDKGFEEDLQFDSTKDKTLKEQAPVEPEQKQSALSFAPVEPDFTKLDESKDTKKVQKPHRGLLAAARSEEKKMLGTVPEVEPLPPFESSLFSFTGFGKQFAKPVELVAEKEAIVEHNGVYVISNDVETVGIKQDPSFRKLVESVLK